MRERASQAPGQSAADTNKILKAAVPPSVKSRRTEFVAIESSIRPAYPVGATIALRARMVAATWSLRMALLIAEFVGHPEVLEALEAVTSGGVAGLYDVGSAILTRCLMMTTAGEVAGPPPVTTVVGPTKNYRLSPDDQFMGWAHPKQAVNQQHGIAWKGSGLTAVLIDASCFAYVLNNVAGVIRDTCLAKAHGARNQGSGTLCLGCQLGKGCTCPLYTS